MMRLVSDNSDDLTPLDFVPTLRSAVKLADIGAWDIRLRLPDGRRMSVKNIVRNFNLTRYVNLDLA